MSNWIKPLGFAAVLSFAAIASVKYFDKPQPASVVQIKPDKALQALANIRQKSGACVSEFIKSNMGRESGLTNAEISSIVMSDIEFGLRACAAANVVGGSEDCTESTLAVNEYCSAAFGGVIGLLNNEV